MKKYEIHTTMTPTTSPDQYALLRSGDLEAIAQSVDPDTILEHFGEESFEWLAWEHSQADALLEEHRAQREERYLERLEAEGEKGRYKYHIPKMTENPAVEYGMLQAWIKRFCVANDFPLPTGFWKRDKRQLQGMFYGMLETYKIEMEDIVERLRYS